MGTYQILSPTESPNTGLTELTLGGNIASSSNPIPVTLVTTIAGEDIANNRMMISDEVVLSNTNTHNAVSILTGSVGTITNAVYSSSINCADYRTYSMVGWGADGNIQLLLQISFDGGTTWLWNPNGFTTASQFVCQQNLLYPTPLCRVAAVNTSGSTQNVTTYLALGR